MANDDKQGGGSTPPRGMSQEKWDRWKKAADKFDQQRKGGK